MHLNKLYIRRVLLSGCLISVCILGFLYWASSDIDSGVYMNCLCHGSDTKRCVTLTFDDGPNEEMTPKILDILKHHNLKATFFLIGNNASRYPELVTRIINEGHIIGNHSWNHSCTFPLQSSEDIYSELSKCDSLIYSITGKRMSLFRPPFGVTNPLIADAINETDYTCIGWSVRSLDTDEDTPRQDILNRVLRQLHNGAIILLHDRCKGADELLQMLIEEIKAQNYGIINIDEMLDVDPYKMDI